MSTKGVMTCNTNGGGCTIYTYEPNKAVDNIYSCDGWLGDQRNVLIMVLHLLIFYSSYHNLTCSHVPELDDSF